MTSIHLFFISNKHTSAEAKWVWQKMAIWQCFIEKQKKRTRKFFKLIKFSFIWVWYVAPRQHIHDVKHMWNECEVDLNWNIFAENSRNAQCCEKYVSKSKVRHMNMSENKACNLFIVHRKWIFPTQTHACIAHSYRFKPISIYISYKL